MRWFGLVWLLLISGCAYRVLTRDDLNAMRPAISGTPSIVLAVREKAPNNDDVNPQYPLLLKALRSSGFFKEVDLEGYTHETPQFVLEVTTLPHVKTPDLACGEAILAPIMTLGIFPVSCNLQYVASYRLLATRDARWTDIDVEHSSKSWTGLIAYPLRLSDSWESEYDYARFYEMVADRVFESTQASASITREASN